MSVDDTKTVITPEQVAVTYTLAGIGTRFGAMVVDTFAQAGMVALVVVILTMVMPGLAVAEVSSLARTLPAWVLATFMIIIFGIIWGYFVFWETVWSGRTPGKRLAGIRVLRDDGYPVDFRAAFVRNIARYVDFLPFAYGVGALTVFFSKDSKRLGDYAAGTVVVMDARAAPRPKDAYPGLAGQSALGDPSLLNLRALSREQFGVVERFVLRRGDLSAKVRREIAKKIAEPLYPVIGMEPPTDPNFPHEVFLVELTAAYRALGR